MSANTDDKTFGLFPSPDTLWRDSGTRSRGTLEKPLKIWEITELIKGTLEGEFKEIAIIGEVSNFKPHPSGHLYFSLKDDKACISAVMFKGSTGRMKFKMHDGLRIVAIGRISVYAPRGSYQIVITRLEPDGMGALQLAFEQLKKKLDGEGFFNPARKRPLPSFPRGVGIVTSPSGAAVRDMLNILERRFASLPVMIYPVKVQGDGAAAEIAEGIRHLNLYFGDRLDVLIVGRGGGSIEDLWAFNEEIVARAIFDSRLPVISAVGHEVDFTIADFVADLRAPTPSAAAELVISSKVDVWHRVDSYVRRLMQVPGQLEFFKMKLDDLDQRLAHSLHRKVSDRMLSFEKLKGRLSNANPARVLERQKIRCETLTQRLIRLPQPKLDRVKWQVERFEEKLKLLNPRTIMDRGYSIVRIAASGKVVKKVSDVRMGDKLLIELAKGKITAKI